MQHLILQKQTNKQILIQHLRKGASEGLQLRRLQHTQAMHIQPTKQKEKLKYMGASEQSYM